MSHRDLRDFAPDSQIQTAVCVIGSGPAGSAVALELAAAGIDVVVLESGGLDVEADTNALYDIENVGLPRVPQDEVRVRQYGGTSTVWTGRCAPFRDIDYERRPWVDHSGWPFGPDELAPYLGRASEYLSLAPSRYDATTWSEMAGKTPAPRLDTTTLDDELWQFSNGVLPGEPVRVNVDLDHRLREEPTIDLILHANVLEIVPKASGDAVDHVVASTLEGTRVTVAADTVVVAAGAIESARLLLASRSVVPTGLGNDRDLVGRYYMEHPFVEVGAFDVNDDMMALLSRFGLFWHDTPAKHVFLSGLALSPRVQRARELLNCAMYVLPETPENTAMHAARRLAKGEGNAMHDVRTLLGSPMEVMQAAKRRQMDGLPPIPPPSRVVIGANAEQRPDPQSRITLSDQTDALGMPLSRIDWRMDDLEFATIETMFELVQTELAAAGLPVPEMHASLRTADDWRTHVVDTAHHSCCVRMGSDPATSVTDEWGHVRGVDGLFVAGSALFPTVGTANPTLMLTGVAMRVADAVRARHRPPAAETTVEAAPRSRPGIDRPCRVAMVGSGHRAENVLLPVLEAMGNDIELVGFTSRRADHREAFGSRAGAPGYEDADALVEGADPDLLVVAVSGDVNEAMVRHLLGAGRPMLVETPWAWGTDAGRALLEAASGRTDIGVAEQFPFRPMDILYDRILRDGVIGRARLVTNESATWDYHGLAQMRRYLGPMSNPAWVSASAFSPLLGDATGELAPRDAYSATIGCADGSAMTQRFVNFYDPPLRRNHHFTIDAEQGSIHDDTVTYVDPVSGDVVSTQISRVEADGRLQHLEVDLGRLDTKRWDNPWADSTLDDEQIGVAHHVRAMVEVAGGYGSPIYRPADAQVDVELLHAIRLSAQHGGRVQLPLRTRREQARKLASPDMVRSQLDKVTGKVLGRFSR